MPMRRTTGRTMPRRRRGALAAAYLLCAGGASPSPAVARSNARTTTPGWGRRRAPFVAPGPSARRWKKALFEVRGGADEDGSEGGAAVIDADVATAVADDGEAAAPADGVEPAAAEGGEESTADAAEGGEEDVAVEEEEPVPRNLTFSATKPHDGSAEDPDGLPARFLAMKKGDREEAKECFAAHLAWRAELAVDDLLSRPHPKFDLCKALVPHYIAGRDPHGNVVFVQRPALLDFELMRKNNSTIDDLLLHYVYVIEYCWNILEPGPPEGIMTNVLDMRGLSFRSMKNQEYIGFAKRFVNMMSMNYPGRSYKTLIVNAPKWFHALYKVFKPLLRESTRQKIVILKAGEQQDQALKFYLGDALPQDLITGDGKHEPGTRYFIPVEESEKCEPGPNSEVEFDMRQFCIEQLNFHNETMQEVL